MCALIYPQAFALVHPATQNFSQAEPGESLPGGSATVNKKRNTHSFSHGSANLKFSRKMNFSLGNALFKKIWVASHRLLWQVMGLGLCSTPHPASVVT